ncbi:signal recognition particle-docking protein FtsY [Candidatus Methylopumilus planktonicus]|jgi:fused signal recognition particle receptor|uniref:signal recognition particle-docking protein FtsY n=1 Tax=Candidatus Methylopumilus planktonicus TaxID=1581557 RepID=UPI00111ED050|nr:signal recognition particle-docking protein FtsY [Candidatus Methylopumilus planktonicus]QDD11183.1 signal recognition particle-docking protein FtsY [Candidatus Methylopumilus planktonicus]QDD23653.1 signal recognition particle-docking protein FtsY [Candidatus Methylopumilus planktonicus]
MFEFLKKIIKKNSPEKKPAAKKEVIKKPEKKTSSAPKKIVAKAPNLLKKKKALKTESSIKPPPKALKKKSLEIKEEKAPPKEEKKSGFFGLADKIKKGLTKTREKLTTELTSLFTGKKIDEALFEELETILLTSDVGISATTYLLDSIRASIKKNKIENADEIKGLLKEKLIELLSPIQNPLVVKGTSPFVIMVVGVNGAGKTTTIGKLTKIFLDENKSVLIAAGDTFRAAATEQLEVWGERNNVHVVSQASGDPSAVIFDAINSAKAKNIDIVIADTAGRLPTQKHLIDEITKIKRVINKCHLEAPHEILLVLDANTGQNAISQLKIFNEALGITGLALTKLDGTAKGGVIAAIAKEQPAPLRYIGVGESIDDLRVFNAQEYVDALF